MGFVPFAFSVNHFINSVGADAGFASIIGLAILILLYFAQARETASLRAQAHDAAGRIGELEARLAQLARSQGATAATAQAQAAASRAVAVAGAGPISASRGPAQQVFAGAPVAPAGVAAPPLAAATKLIPTPVPAAVAFAPSQAPDAAPGGVAPGPATVAGGAGVGAGGGSNGSSHQPPLGTRPVAAPAAMQAPPPRIQGRPGSTIPPGRRSVPPPRGRATQRTGRSRLGLVVLLGAMAAIAVVAVVLLLTGGGGKATSTSASTPTTNALNRRRIARRASVNPATVTVAVLNGTASTGLAHTVSQNLVSLGYKQGAVQTATDQTHATTVVAYLPGFKQDALAVANSLKLSPASVAPVDQAAQAVACPGPGACTADVIATVGADLAANQ
jgi:hypothetical protein